MKKLSDLLLLMVLLFSVTITLSAADFESVNPFEFQIQGTIETTIFQTMGGIDVLYDVERVAVSVESIQPCGYCGAELFFIGSVDHYLYNHENTIRFIHPAVLGIV